MNNYEMIYILDASISDEEKEALIAKFEGVVTKNGGVVEKIDKWGVKNSLTLSTIRRKVITYIWRFRATAILYRKSRESSVLLSTF